MVLFQVKINGRARSKKNSKQIFRGKNGRPFITSSNQFKQWAIYASLFIRRAKTSNTIDFPVSLKITANYTNKKNQQDIDNVVSSVCDILQDSEIIKNDNLIYTIEARKIYDAESDSISIEINKLIDKT